MLFQVQENRIRVACRLTGSLLLPMLHRCSNQRTLFDRAYRHRDHQQVCIKKRLAWLGSSDLSQEGLALYLLMSPTTTMIRLMVCGLEAKHTMMKTILKSCHVPHTSSMTKCWLSTTNDFVIISHFLLLNDSKQHTIAIFQGLYLDMVRSIWA